MTLSETKVDQIGVQERVARLQSRSIKNDSKKSETRSRSPKSLCPERERRANPGTKFAPIAPGQSELSETRSRSQEDSLCTERTSLPWSERLSE